MNALELADALDWVCENHLVGIGDADFKATATMLRQKYAQHTPLTNELIRDIQAMCHLKNVGYDTFIMRFARAIERAHGIGE